MKKSTIFRTVSITIMLLLVVLTGCQQQTPSTKTPPATPQIETKDGVKTYINTKYNFTFNVCNNREFEVEENYGGTTVALLGPRLNDFKRRICVTVTVIGLSANSSLEEYLKSSLKEAEKSLTKFAVTDETTIQVSDITAKQSSFTYTATIGDQEYIFQDKLIVFMKDNKIYAIKYDVPEEFYNEYSECFNSLVSTFKFR
jgi:hypothetical protein